MEHEPAASDVSIPGQTPAANPLAPPNPSATKPRSFLGKLYHDLSPKWSLLRLLVFIIIPLAVGIPVFNLCFLRIEVDGISMEPTYYGGNRNLVFKLAYQFSPPQRGDVVAVQYQSVMQVRGRTVRNERGEPMLTNEILLKRVIGLPGETVKFQSGRLSVNGHSLEEPHALYGPVTNQLNGWVTQSNEWWGEEQTLGPDEYWVIGDNRTMPPIFHTHPRIQRKAILGKALF